MTYDAVVVNLPTADRARSYAFYTQAFGLEAVDDELGDDGVPEPLQFTVNAGVRVMLVPYGGFGWVLGGADVASPDTHECILALSVLDVDGLVAQAVGAGATVVTPPGQQPWGYAGAVADPDGHVWMIRRAEGSF